MPISSSWQTTLVDPRLTRRLLSTLEGILPASQFGEELKRNVREAVSGVLQDMDVVTREEFETQQQVLLKTREKAERLEVQLQEYEVKD